MQLWLPTLVSFTAHRHALNQRSPRIKHYHYCSTTSTRSSNISVDWKAMYFVQTQGRKAAVGGTRWNWHRDDSVTDLVPGGGHRQQTNDPHLEVSGNLLIGSSQLFVLPLLWPQLYMIKDATMQGMLATFLSPYYVTTLCRASRL